MARAATITMIFCEFWGFSAACFEDSVLTGYERQIPEEPNSVQYHTHDAERNTDWSRLAWQARCMNCVVVREIRECGHSSKMVEMRTCNWTPDATCNWTPNMTCSWTPDATWSWTPDLTWNWTPDLTCSWTPDLTWSWTPDATCSWTPDATCSWTLDATCSWTPDATHSFKKCK